MPVLDGAHKDERVPRSMSLTARSDTYCRRGHYLVRSALTSDHCDEIDGIPSQVAFRERRIGATVSLEGGMIIHRVGE